MYKTPEDVARMAQSKRHYVCISVPRNVGACVGQAEQTKVYNEDELKEVVVANQEERLRKAHKTQALIVDELAAFDMWRDSLETMPKRWRVSGKGS